MGSDDPTRRDLLRTGGGLAATGLAFGVAGCTSSVPIIGGGGSAPTDYDAWLVAPSAVGADHYEFSVTDYGTLRENADRLGSGYRTMKGFFSGFLGMVGVQFDQLSTSVSVGQGTSAGISGKVTTGSFDRETVERSLENLGASSSSSYKGYTVYGSDGGGAGGGIGLAARVTAVGRGAIVSGQDVRTVEALVDASKGNAKRYPEASSDCKTLLDNLDDGVGIVGGTNPTVSGSETGGGVVTGPSVQGQVADGMSTSIDGSNATVTLAVVFDSESDVDVTAVEEYVSDLDGAGTLVGGSVAMGSLSDAGDVSTSTAGRAVVARGTIKTSNIFSGGMFGNGGNGESPGGGGNGSGAGRVVPFGRL